MAEKYVGCTVTIIYEDAANAITQRTIKVISIVDGKVMAHDFQSSAMRAFVAERILAVQLIRRGRSA